MKVRGVILFLISGMALTHNAFGANMRFLESSVWAEFTGGELASFKQFIGSKMDKVADGEILVWESAESARKGKMKVKFTHTSGELTCRRTAFGLVGENGDQELYKFDVCKQNGNWQVMEVPTAAFTKADWKLLQAKGEEALNLDESGEPLTWFNQETGNGGVFVALTPYKKKGERCRDLAITVTNKEGKSANGRYAFCKTAAGKWHRDFGGENDAQ